MEVGLEFNDFVSYACVDLLHYCYYSSWICYMYYLLLFVTSTLLTFYNCSVDPQLI
ncbi:hypothetical protein HanRHA438_Chr00c62g0860441 [Helianthus annuus]|nr:hypothetical protein HanRHA438_Chr00c62g0860441 [Helianthus annuus]